MSKDINDSLKKEQTDPRIEDEILTYLDSGLKESALSFITYLNANQMTPRPWFWAGLLAYPLAE